MMDSDAICKPDSLKLLLSWFSDRKIGAVCGQHLIEKEKVDFITGQVSILSELASHI